MGVWSRVRDGYVAYADSEARVGAFPARSWTASGLRRSAIAHDMSAPRRKSPFLDGTNSGGAGSIDQRGSNCAVKGAWSAFIMRANTGNMHHAFRDS